MNILCHCFDSAADEDKEILGKFFASCDYHGAGYTYLANLIWKDSYCICWEQFGDYLIIAGSDCMRADSDIVISACRLGHIRGKFATDFFHRVSAGTDSTYR